MPGVYSVEDLLKLRASPLISKPPGLPPIEEWMGPADANPRRPPTRTRLEEAAVPVEGFVKRPLLTDRKSTTDPERIVLGPPKRSFASSNARKYGALDNDEPTPSKDKSTHHERHKTGEESEHKYGDRRSGTFGSTNGKNTTRYDTDSASGDRPRRRHDDEDGDLRGRKEYDRPKWGTKDGRDDDEKAEEGIPKSAFRRDPQTRSKLDHPWARGGRGGESIDEGRKEGPAWRRGAKDREYGMSDRVEVDPEWMDATDGAEPAHAHTQEDFQRWKERMKSGGAETDDRSAQRPPTAPDLQDKPTIPTIPAVGPPPEILTASIDKLFEKFADKNASSENKTTGKPTKSRFASIFGPQQDVKPEAPATIASAVSPVAQFKAQTVSAPVQVPAPTQAPALALIPVPAAPAPVSATVPAPSHTPSNNDADRAGFEMILQMLGKREAGTTTQHAPPAKTHTPSHVTDRDALTDPRFNSPDLASLFSRDQQYPTRHTPLSHSQNPSLDRPLGPSSPAEHGQRSQTKIASEELLLNLLRQSDLGAKPPQQPNQQFSDQRSASGNLGIRLDQERQPSHLLRGEGSRTLFDDPAISGMRFRDELEPQPGIQRRPTGGANPSMFADMNSENYLRNSQFRPGPHNLPPGLHRPPGLDQIPQPPPGWMNQQPNQIQPHQQQQSRQAGSLPPGIMPSLNRSMPPLGGPQQSSYPPGQQPPRPVQRKYTGDSSIPNFPPPMPPPPPGFGPQAGFHGQAGSLQNMGRYAMGGGPNMAERDRIGSIFADMYANDRNANGLRGGANGPPPGFR